MHLLVRETQSIDAQEVAEDLGHAPADVVVLSFSDSDLLGLERAYAALPDPGFTLRLTNLGRLRHPMSVDLYLEQTIAASRLVVVRLLGGVEYWRYGVEELTDCCREHDIPLVLLPGDAREDPRLLQWSRVPEAACTRLSAFMRGAGAQNMAGALMLMRHLAGRGADDGRIAADLPPAGLHRRGQSATWRATVVFYRAHLLAGDIAPIEALADQLEEAGIAADVVYVASLKNPDAAEWLAGWLMASPPDIILNATFFTARGNEGEPSVLETAGVPVLQLLQPGSTREACSQSSRGLSQSDLAMQVVLPELDGRLSGAPISFKSVTAPGFPARHCPDTDGIMAVVTMALGWIRLGHLLPQERRIGIVLSDYPGALGQTAHAVGLDTFASLESILTLLRDAGYDSGTSQLPVGKELAKLLAGGSAPKAMLGLEAYRQAFQTLPEDFQNAVIKAWGAPEADTALSADGFFCLRFLAVGNLVLAVQPDRGSHTERKALYHDPDRPPCHAYIAFYLWLRMVQGIDAMVHLGTHGTLEWLPGKSVALSASCAPWVLNDGLPVIYPFIVNNPGEAAAAKRRLGAVTIGHMTPPVLKAALTGDMAELETLIDEFAEADGLDRRRATLLRRSILERATQMGVLAESGVRPGEDNEDEALARLDAYLCDVKDLQIRDGLHVFGRPAPEASVLVDTIAQASGVKPAIVAEQVKASGQAEADGLLHALEALFIEPGPAGAPTRGRLDVLPTGRNLFTMDPRAIPTPTALTLARRQVQQILLRHLQEEGEPLRHLVIDLWGSASLRTGGEDLALALLLMGVEPVWEGSSGRVTGVEIIPMAVLDRPRVDVTLRISGFFRDAFPAQIALFDQAVQAVAEREEAPALNSLADSVRGLEGAARRAATARIFGAAPATYGTGIEGDLAQGRWETRSELGQSYLAGNGWTYGGGRDGTREETVFARQLQQAQGILHVQDHAETDILESPENASHEGGLAAAADMLGASPKLWHGDTSNSDAPKLRDMHAEIVRVVRGRLASPRWIAGMQRHDYRGAAEMARGLEALCGFAGTLPARFDRQFDLVFAATLGDVECDRFLQQANPLARQDMLARYADMIRRGLWHPRQNSVLQILEDTA
ncbi:cobaltochelatase subunit CobN [Gluconobacter sp. Dm-62]|uniref:cobaltochelatase subunit CobN n=1 Tax=Gluconobacter sp. Dm-62 TaxID=2799804 RepID=UPI001B8CB3DF|nr:cobaltochelatase subunit CobN [Gluconobacter sp. Dm-62]MBS1103585.1 cobaltochelatase subunit CobN [Gluconobacter sp. Dm-62]